jgi:hypothetical protein
VTHPGSAATGWPGPTPVRIAEHVCYPKQEIFEVCGALALAEAMLRRLGRPVDAARMAAVFEVVEGGLAR